MLRVFGILGMIVGLVMIVLTATGAAFHAEPARGYIVGAVFLVAGAFRFVRGMNQ